MKNLRKEMVKKIGPVAGNFGDWISFKQSKLASGKTFVQATFPAEYECRSKKYSAAAAGLTVADCLDLDKAIKLSGGQPTHSNAAAWIID